MKTIVSVLLLLLGVIAASAFYVIQPKFNSVRPVVLRVGILPDVSVDNFQQHYDPLLDYLSAETGIDFKLVASEDYADLIGLFRDHEVDLPILVVLPLSWRRIFMQPGLW